MKTLTIETGVSDYHKMIMTFLKHIEQDFDLR